jgi:uncharacterized protein YjbI with pentapeptide repeats
MAGLGSRQAYNRRPKAPREAGSAELDRQIARIDALSRGARANWLGLIAYLAFAGVTLLGVQDADFFLESRRTALPLIGVDIPTRSFFYVAPILGVALYVYLHLHLMNLWHALAEASATQRGKPLGHRVFPWLVNDLAMGIHPARPRWRHPLRWLSDVVTLALVWAAGPIVLAGLWWRSMPAHEFWMTQLAGVCLFASVVVGLISLWAFRKMIAGHGTDLTAHWRRRWSWGAVGLAVGLALIGGSRSTWDLGRILFLPPLASADLRELELVEKPADWRDHDEARRLFRVTWCDRMGLPMHVCGAENPSPQDQETLAQTRRMWCRTNMATATEGGEAGASAMPSDAACTAAFNRWESGFEDAWQDSRKAYLEALPTVSIRDRDLRRADLEGAFLAGVDLRSSLLRNASLFEATLEGADLTDADFSEADLRGANLPGAKLWNTDFSLARMQQADLRGAHLMGADLSGTAIEGAYFTGAILLNADLAFVMAHDTDFTNSQLSQKQLATAIGDYKTFLPADAITDLPLHVSRCLAPSEAVEDDLKSLADRSVHVSFETLRRKYLCPEGTKPDPVGTYVPRE